MKLSEINKLFIRNEIYPNEYRAPIVPNDVKKLITHGYQVYIQSSEYRCFSDQEYTSVGAIITHDDWTTYNDCMIIGIKELGKINELNAHTHVYFSHSYKNQIGSDMILKSFAESKSILYDLEYFTNSNQRRIIAFGFYAGFIGAGLGLLQYLNKKIKKCDIRNLSYWESSDKLIKDIKNFDADLAKLPDISICVIGPNGRCGLGALSLLDLLGFKFTSLNSKQDKTNLESYDIVINCINLTKNIGTWYDTNTEFKSMSVIVDVSCDYTNEFNPIKIYKDKTTWEIPVFSHNDNVDVIAIDNLPSLLPKESSTEFSSILTNLIIGSKLDVDKHWENNLKIYLNKINKPEKIIN